MDCMPMIFQTSTLSYEERFDVYWRSILGNCKACEVVRKISDYVERFVVKRGWKAIWSCARPDGSNSKDSFNVLVAIVDVCPHSLSADVIISKPLVTDSALTLEEVQEMIREINYKVPLMQLLPVYDDSGDFDETALALEHVRFFFEHLWRDWDDDDDGDYSYAARNLENRLRLHYDIAQNNLSKSFIKRYTATYNEYKKKVADLKKLRKDMAASDSEQELDTSDVVCLAKKTHELEDIVKSLQTMENPQMRYLLASASVLERPFVEVNRNYSVTMIIAPLLTAKMVKGLPDETIIEHYSSLGNAVERCAKGDRILIFLECYVMTGPLNFMKSVAVTGVGKTIIRCNEDDETSITAHSPDLRMENITFIQNPSSSHILVIQKGRTILINCEFDCTSNGLAVKRGAELVMKNCRIHGALSAGLTIEESSLVHVEGCEIRNNGRHDNDGGIKIIASKTEPASILLVNNNIVENFGLGLNIVDNEMVASVDHEAVGGVRLEQRGNVIKQNTVELD